MNINNKQAILFIVLTSCFVYSRAEDVCKIDCKSFIWRDHAICANPDSNMQAQCPTEVHSERNKSKLIGSSAITSSEADAKNAFNNTASSKFTGEKILENSNGENFAKKEQSQIIPISNNSYENRNSRIQEFKGVVWDVSESKGLITASTFFQFPDGAQGFIAYDIRYDHRRDRQDASEPAEILIYKKLDGLDYWSKQRDLIDYKNSVKGCIHPRKVIASDFNKDGVVDFAFACTGWDDTPFPGERSTVLLSQNNGKYVLNYINESPEFTHGGASGDLNGDGFPDLILGDKYSAAAYMNDGKGNFSKSKDFLFPHVHRPATIEYVDVNNDGMPDLVLGASEKYTPTKIIINPGNNKFDGRFMNAPKEIEIPKIKGAGEVLDFLYSKINNSIYILRTGDGQYGTTYYSNVWIQKFDLASNQSTLVYENISNAEPGARKSRTWNPWIYEKDGYITTNYGIKFKIKIE